MSAEETHHETQQLTLFADLEKDRFIYIWLRCRKCARVWHQATIDRLSWWGKGVKPESCNRVSCPNPGCEQHDDVYTHDIVTENFNRVDV